MTRRDRLTVGDILCEGLVVVSLTAVIYFGIIALGLWIQTTP